MVCNGINYYVAGVKSEPVGRHYSRVCGLCVFRRQLFLHS